MIEIPGYKVHREIDHSDYCRSFSAIQLSTGKTMMVSVFSHTADQYALFKAVFDEIEHKVANRVFGVITPIKEFIKTQDYTYIISDLLSNSCAQIYKDRVVESSKLIEQIYKIAASIDLYHSIGFYHGGISLENLYHDADGNLILGLAAFNQHFNPDATARTNLNKESYEAPEKEVSQSLSRDYYALGVVLYELIFKQKPFIADNKTALEQLKLKASLNIADDRYTHLEPLFLALLNPDPDQRISNAKQFHSLCDQIGLKLNQFIFQIETLESENVILTQEDTSQSKPFSPKKSPMYFYAALIVIISIALLGYLMTAQDGNDTKEMNQIPKETFVDNVPKEQDSLGQVDTAEEVLKLIKKANNQFKEKQNAAALMTVNQALKIQPGQSQGLKLKQLLENEIKINTLLTKAKALVKQGLIIQPKEENALKTYRRIQAMLPKGDTRAINGLKQISSIYLRNAEREYNKNSFSKAKQIIVEGLTIIPGEKALLALRSKIAQTELAIQQKATQQRLAEQAQQAKLQEQEQQRQAALLQQQQQQEQLLKQQQRENERKQQIAKIVQQVEENLVDNQLTLNSIKRAINFSNSLNLISADASTKSSLATKINKAYESLAEYQLSKGLYKQVETTVSTGLKYSPANATLIRVRSQAVIAQAQQARQREQAKTAESQQQTPPKQSLPIFGTF